MKTHDKSRLEMKKLFPKWDVLVLVILVFCVVLLIVGYDVYQIRTAKTQESSAVTIPPVTIQEVDVSIFEYLRTLK